jgi:heat shock protein HslJ
MGNRKQAICILIIVLILFSLQGCNQKPNELAGTEWNLVTLTGNNLIPNTTITIHFTEDYLGGQMSCNGYGGSPDTGKYHISSDVAFTLGSPFAVTVQLCTEPKGIMEQEAAYIEALQNAAHFNIWEDQLEFENDDGETSLVFQKLKPDSVK